MKRASERELLRQQMELLAEESEDTTQAELPRLTNAMCEVGRTLECSFDRATRITFFFFVSAYFVVSILIQIKKLLRSES